MRTLLWMAATSAVLVSGCVNDGSVRYVYQDRDFGVVGMPENTNRWPSRYRHRAEKLMARQFPEGHEIVRAEEVEAGSRTLKIEGANSAEISPQAPSHLLSLAKLGRTTSRSQSDVVKIKECRIVYRRRGPAEGADYSADAEANPSRYLDPNDFARKKLESGDDDGGKKSDPAGAQAGRSRGGEGAEEG